MSLKTHVEEIARELEEGLEKEDYYTEEEEPTAYDYLEQALDINYKISSNGDYKSGEVLVAFGGPNIYVNTEDNSVRGYWWGSKEKAFFTDNIGLDEALEEIYYATKQ